MLLSIYFLFDLFFLTDIFLEILYYENFVLITFISESLMSEFDFYWAI